MKILGTESFDVNCFQGKGHYFQKGKIKKRRSKEFDEVLESTINEDIDDFEGFRILLPTNGRFWDNGYEDK